MINKKILITLFVFSLSALSAQNVELRMNGFNGKVYLSSINGEVTSLCDSSSAANGRYLLSTQNLLKGLYRISFDKNNRSWQSQAQTGWIDFVNDGEDVSIVTNANSVLDSLRVIESESNKLFYSFLRLNKEYKTKTELLNIVLSHYPKDDPYYSTTRQRFGELQHEYFVFVNATSQKEPNSFIARYISSAQLPVVDIKLLSDKHVEHLKSNALNNVDFNDAVLTHSDLFTNKTIEYLTYFRNPQLPKELLETEFMKAVDTLLNKAKVNQLVYQHITEYLIDGFKKFGFDQILDYIVENYVIKDDLCLDEQTEDMIKRRIDQARILKIGSIAPNFIAPDVNNSKIELSKLDADKILLVFYASWCPHCKELLPQLNSLKKDFVGKKFEVIAISLDTEKEEWSNMIKECSSLINVSDLKGWESNVAGDYFIYATPTMFLLDREKKIIGKPLNLEEVKSKVQ